MAGRKILLLVAAALFLLLGIAALYRLLVGFPISVGGTQFGQTSSFFAFVICVVISLILFREARTARGGNDGY